MDQMLYTKRFLSRPSISIAAEAPTVNLLHTQLTFVGVNGSRLRLGDGWAGIISFPASMLLNHSLLSAMMP
jgi:hypothetical protein